MAPTYWLLVGTPENYEKTAALGWSLVGVKSRHRRKAEKMQPGDKVLFYLTRVKAFGGILTITSPYREETTPIWKSEKPGELYPFRVETTPDLVLPLAKVLPAAAIVPALEYPKRWPAENWTLAFQGNVHIFNQADYDHLRGLIAARAAEA